MSDDNADKVELHVNTRESHDQMVASVPIEDQADLEKDLRFLRNMSTVGSWHAFIGDHRRRMWSKYSIDIFDYVDTLFTSVWTYSKLVEELDFCGCEVLHVDAEGHDTRIIRSMVKHCLSRGA